jgi:hypothetical protein
MTTLLLTSYAQITGDSFLIETLDSPLKSVIYKLESEELSSLDGADSHEKENILKASAKTILSSIYKHRGIIPLPIIGICSFLKKAIDDALNLPLKDFTDLYKFPKADTTNRNSIALDRPLSPELALSSRKKAEIQSTNDLSIDPKLRGRSISSNFALVASSSNMNQKILLHKEKAKARLSHTERNTTSKGMEGSQDNNSVKDSRGQSNSFDKRPQIDDSSSNRDSQSSKPILKWWKKQSVPLKNTHSDSFHESSPIATASGGSVPGLGSPSHIIINSSLIKNSSSSSSLTLSAARVVEETATHIEPTVSPQSKPASRQSSISRQNSTTNPHHSHPWFFGSRHSSQSSGLLATLFDSHHPVSRNHVEKSLSRASSRIISAASSSSSSPSAAAHTDEGSRRPSQFDAPPLLATGSQTSHISISGSRSTGTFTVAEKVVGSYLFLRFFIPGKNSIESL